MRRLAVAVVAAFFVAVEFLRWQGIIDFGALYVFSHTWYLIPMWYGIKLAQQKSKSMKTSGFVLIVFAGFMLIMSMIELFSETQDSIYYITVAGTLIFWPLVMIMFFLSVLVSLFDKGEEVHKSFLTQRTVECPEQELLDTSLSTVLGKLTFVMNLKSVSHRAVRLDILALFGKVEIVVPEDVGAGRTKSIVCRCRRLGKLSRKLVGGEAVRPGGREPEPRLLLVIRSCFGSVAVKYESRRS